jgi:two-component system, OmpR family, sensor kinase
VSLLQRLRGLSISGRSFLLVFVALVVAEGIAVTLFVLKPPLRNAPVSVREVASMLRLPGDPVIDRGFGFGFGPGGDHRPGQDPGPGIGPMPPDRRNGEGPPRLGENRMPNANLRIEDLAAPPAPLRKLDAGTTASTLRSLASELGIDSASLRVQVPQDRQAHYLQGPRPGERLLGEGFVAARLLPDGRWRTITSVVEGFPNAFQRQAITLFVLGLALLLPLAWLFARALAAPIRRFAEGAQRLGNDPVAPPLPRSGPQEMQQAVDAFNTMQARLNRLLQERTQMVGAIAHDLRTPLTRLAFRLEDLPSPLREKVGSDIQEMKSMITAALDFLRDRSNTGERERLDLRLLVERITDDHADLGHDASFAAGEPVTIHGVPLALRRMLVNLVENALKYGERARLRLHVTDSFAVIEIDDDGPGIPEFQQQQVFEPFFRLEGSRNRDTGGIGLGLASARSIALDHGGEIVLANRRGGGLRATVRLPLQG